LERLAVLLLAASSVTKSANDDCGAMRLACLAGAWLVLVTLIQEIKQ
jgi:hypothetical protein